MENKIENDTELMCSGKSCKDTGDRALADLVFSLSVWSRSELMQLTTGKWKKFWQIEKNPCMERNV